MKIIKFDLKLINVFILTLYSIWQIGRLLPTEEYQERIVPCLVKLFESSDRNARYKLLCQLETFVEHLSSKVSNSSKIGLIK